MRDILCLLFIYFIIHETSSKTVYTMDVKMAQHVLLAHRQLQGRATDAAP